MAVEPHPREVYLRVCGGTRKERRSTYGSRGLSPRVRRHQYEPHLAPSIERSISACAEAPLPSAQSAFSPRVYLRVCGGT